MNDQDKEDYGKLFSRYTEISEDFSEQAKNSLFESPKKMPIKFMKMIIIKVLEILF